MSGVPLPPFAAAALPLPAEALPADAVGSRARSLTPARDEALSSADALHHIFTHLVSLNALAAAEATCKIWRAVARGIEGWRALRHEASFTANPLRKPPWLKQSGGPKFIAALPHPFPSTSKTASSHPLRRDDCVAVFDVIEAPSVIFNDNNRLRMHIVSIKDGRVLASFTLDMHFSWSSAYNCQQTFMATFTTSFTNPHLIVYASSRPSWDTLEMEEELTCFGFRGEELATMECHKLSKAFPKGINSLCVSWDHLFMTRDQRVGAISLEAVAQGRFEEEATTIFTVPELESMEPFSFDGISCDMDGEYIAFTCARQHCVYTVHVRKGAHRKYTAGGGLHRPFDVAYMALSYLYVLDLAEGFDRLVVLDLLSGAPLQTMRFGRVGESNLRCISLMAYNQRVILGDAYRHKLLVLKPHAATADSWFAPRRNHSRHALHGHGHGILAGLEYHLSHGLVGETLTDEELDMFRKRLELFHHVESTTDKLWFVLIHLLWEQPDLRTTLTVPPEIEDRWWATERYGFTLAGYTLLPQHGLRQTTLKLKPPVRWEWALYGELGRMTGQWA